MTLKKFKAKSHKSTVKRIKISNGGDLSKGKLMISRPNQQHRNIGKSRSVKLKRKRLTILSKGFNKLKAVLY